MFKKLTETLVGIFMILGILSLGFLALKVSGLTGYTNKANYYTVTAEFDNVGGLKVRAPIMIAGVSVGEVRSIVLNPTDFRAKVSMRIDKNKIQLPTDTSASIYTQGLLGSNYVNLSPGYADTFLQNGGVIEATNSAVILEKLLGQFLYSFQNKSSTTSTSNNEEPKP